MDQIETDIVLSAIRRGEDSLPKLRTATGLEYAKLHPILHTLEFDLRSIDSSETADGFQRFIPQSNEKPNGNGHKSVVAPTVLPEGERPNVLRALHSTMAAASARELALLQRDAPYCLGCRGLCILHGTDRNDRVRWRCKSCDVTFAGSGSPGDPSVNRLKTEKREKAISAFNEGKSIRQVAKEAKISVVTAHKIRAEENINALCPCGKDAKHKGWCSFRFQNSPARQEVMERMQMAHISADEFCACGFSAKHRGRCKDGQTKGTRHAGEDIIKAITSNGTKPETESAQPERAEIVTVDKTEDKIRARNDRIADFSPSNEGPKSAIERFPRDAFCLRNCDPPSVGHHRDCLYYPANRKPPSLPPHFEQYLIEGILRLHVSISISMADMALWPSYDISNFFSALATLQKLGGAKRA